MTTHAIEALDVGKNYRLGQQQGARMLSEVISASARRVARRAVRPRGEWFAALQGVSFAVPPGEAVGLVGSNGAGKTTLLKLISRITLPSSGSIRLAGRVGSLLEVGTGFHPELTGRENVFLNGSMLGMRRREITKKYDEIVEFAEVERFIDTPVKRYSSGMYVRLAFAVAAHLEPEILLVDEVLAVGDVAFQRKCLGKMGDVASDGRTIVFVSHNLGAMQQLTRSALLLDRGRLVAAGPTRDVISEYGSRLAERGANGGDFSQARRPVSGLAREVELLGGRFPNDVGGLFATDDPIDLEVVIRARERTEGFRLSFVVFAYTGTPVGQAFSPELAGLARGEEATYHLSIPDVRLAPGRYHFALGTGIGDNTVGYKSFDVVADVLDFEVAPATTSEGLVATWEAGWGAIRLPEPVVTRL